MWGPNQAAYPLTQMLLLFTGRRGLVKGRETTSSHYQATSTHPNSDTRKTVETTERLTAHRAEALAAFGETAPTQRQAPTSGNAGEPTRTLSELVKQERPVRRLARTLLGWLENWCTHSWVTLPV